MSHPITTTSRHDHSARRLSSPIAITFGLAAVAVYLILTSNAIVQFVATSSLFRASTQATSSASQPLSADASIPNPDLLSGTPKVLTITVQGAGNSVDVYCATTSVRAP